VIRRGQTNAGPDVLAGTRTSDENEGLRPPFIDGLRHRQKLDTHLLGRAPHDARPAMELVRKFQHELIRKPVRALDLETRATLGDVERDAANACASGQLDLDRELDVAPRGFPFLDGHELSHTCQHIDYATILDKIQNGIAAAARNS